MSKEEQDKVDALLESGKKARLRMYHGLLARVAAGQMLSSADIKTLKALEQDISDQQEIDQSDDKQAITAINIILNTTETAAFFGVTTRSVQNWAKAGCPQRKRGHWNLKAVYDWWWEYIGQDRAEADIGDASINEAKRHYWWAKSKTEEIKNEQLIDRLITWEQIEKEWAGRVAVVAAGLTAMIDRLPPLLVGRDRREMRAIVKQEVLVLRKSYARKGKYVPT
jgi:phage terminase Nu1 subunit (DNA packaging protein)